MFWIEFREMIKIVITLYIVGGLTGRLALILINRLMHLISIKKVIGVILIHFLLLILVFMVFGFFLYWMLQPGFILKNIVDFAKLICLEIVITIAGYSLMYSFKKK